MELQFMEPPAEALQYLRKISFCIRQALEEIVGDISLNSELSAVKKGIARNKTKYAPYCGHQTHLLNAATLMCDCIAESKSRNRRKPKKAYLSSNIMHQK
uniref:Uncharacterized protein n=1 Tax=Romanomermis culicivorax TaxID=13658 RepID=A0A915IJ49_ROMCU